jgi:hypothetical protein
MKRCVYYGYQTSETCGLGGNGFASISKLADGPVRLHRPLLYGRVLGKRQDRGGVTSRPSWPPRGDHARKRLLKKVEQSSTPPPMSRGARRCWRLLDWYRRRFGEVCPRQQKLARRLGEKGIPVTERQVQRYIRELRVAGVVEVKRGGRGNPSYYLVDKFVELQWKTAADVGSNVGSNVGSSASSAAAASHTNETGSTEKCHHKTTGCLGVDGVEAKTVEQSQAVKKPPASAPRRTPNPFNEIEGKAIARAIERCGFEPRNPLLLTKLARKAEFYQSNGFVVAAHIERAIGRCERARSNWPESPNWIVAAVENEFAAASGARASEPKSLEQPLGDTGRPRKQSGGGSPLRVPLAAAGHGARRDVATGGSTVLPVKTPGTPPELPRSDAETTRKGPVTDPGRQSTTELPGKAKSAGGGE